jgi:uncharacterized membrane protein
MTWTDRLGLFTLVDFCALGLLVLAWVVIGWRIENSAPHKLSVSNLMAGFRREWMVQMVTREPRIFDAQLISNMRQGAAFFTSASIIALGGGLALVGNAEHLAGLANELTLEDAPAFVWEFKLLVMLLFVTNAFLKFMWAHRLFGYCAVLMAAVPNDATDPMARVRADQAAEVNITAGRSFNRGMRATYFGLAASAWLLGPYVLIAATIFTVAVLWRREFASKSRAILIANPPHTTK